MLAENAPTTAIVFDGTTLNITASLSVLGAMATVRRAPARMRRVGRASGVCEFADAVVDVPPVGHVDERVDDDSADQRSRQLSLDATRADQVRSERHRVSDDDDDHAAADAGAAAAAAAAASPPIPPGLRARHRRHVDDNSARLLKRCVVVAHPTRQQVG